MSNKDRPEQDENGLSEQDAPADPIELFRAWFDEAAAAVGNPFDATVMTLATATAGATPSARIVLLKHLDARGFVFYTNYDSRKGSELAENPRAALVFHWAMQRRQVRISGATIKVSRDESRAYFHSRPRGSQLGAWASNQSRVIPDRQMLDGKLGQADAEYAGKPVPLPPNWGGFRVVPKQIEFWQHRASRLHDRLRYTAWEGGIWLIERLAP